tara:strand:+ start:356 stop:1243 length:888 start_codon:yes stop_codon:yes gene_type:complete
MSKTRSIQANNLFKRRVDLYREIKSLRNVTSNELLYIFNIKKKNFNKLSKSVFEFIYLSTCIYYKQKFNKKNFLTKNINKVLKLPNITPGGQIRATKETSFLYQKIQINLKEIFIQTGLINYINRGGWISIRIKNSVENVNYKRKKYATSKIHSDSWNGEKNHSKIIINILGDTENNTIKLFKPINFEKNILKKNKSFEDAIKKVKKLKEIGLIKKQKIYLFDQLCLHQTFLKRNCKPRVSLDLRIDIKNNRLNYNPLKEREIYKTYNINQWKKLNFTKIKYHNKSFAALDKEFS